MNEDRKNKIICISAAVFFAAGFFLCVFLPKSDYLTSERRRAALRPEFSLDAVKSGRYMKGFEAWTVDTFPFREPFRTVQALTATRIFLRKDNNGLYEYEGMLAAAEYPLNEASVVQAADRFGEVCERWLTEENRVYLAVIPDKNCFLADKSGHLSLDYEKLERLMTDRMAYATFLPVRDLLEAGDYYRTDTHWRQERITDVAERLLQGMGASDGTGSADYETHTSEYAFYGVYYGQAALPAEPDELRYLTGGAIDGCRVYDWQNKKEIPVYDMELAAGKDPYEMFLSGPLSLVTIENPEISNGKRLVIFRDSFGSSIAPLLAGSYEKITLVDIRYINPELLGAFVDFSGCDVLFLYSTLVLNHSETLK